MLFVGTIRASLRGMYFSTKRGSAKDWKPFDHNVRFMTLDMSVRPTGTVTEHRSASSVTGTGNTLTPSRMPSSTSFALSPRVDNHHLQMYSLIRADSPSHWQKTSCLACIVGAGRRACHPGCGVDNRPKCHGSSRGCNYCECYQRPGNHA